MARIEIYHGAWVWKGEYEIPDRGDVPVEGVTAMMKGVVERDGLFRVRVDGKMVVLGAGALSNSVVVFP